jgi:hypothetical protein
MNANKIINMIIRILLRKGINKGISKGMGAMRGRGGGGAQPDPPNAKPLPCLQKNKQNLKNTAAKRKWRKKQTAANNAKRSNVSKALLLLA